MAGFIVLGDGRAYAASNQGWRATVEAISEALDKTADGKNLAEWLRNDPSVQIYHSVDVRELTPGNRTLLLKAIEAAFQIQKERGSTDWDEPECWTGWIERFSDLVKMIKCVERGEPAHEFNPHMLDVIPARDEKSGPGW